MDCEEVNEEVKPNYCQGLRVQNHLASLLCAHCQRPSPSPKILSAMFDALSPRPNPVPFLPNE
eukprot:2437999-Alexandrium_andersonii.AAC.1